MFRLVARLKDISIISYFCFIIVFIFSVLDWRLISNVIPLNLSYEEPSEFYSSVYCRGNNNTDRLCRFKNLCYNPITDAFLFFHSYKSDIIGVPEDRFSPALVDFSSVHDHNTQYFNFVDLPSSAFSNFSVKLLNGVAILFKRFNPENLMHVFHDDLLPAYVTLKENFLLNHEKNVYFVFADGREPGPYSYLYERFLDSAPVYLSKISDNICFAETIVGLNKHSLWYQYGFKKPQGSLSKDLLLLFPTIVHFRSYFSERFSLSEQSEVNAAVLLTRGHNRKILNSKALAESIETSTNLKTYIISLEKYSVIDVIKKILRSKLVVGMHGSLLILSLFLPPYSHIIELFPFGINPTLCTPYRTLAKIPGLKLAYHSWENTVKHNSFPHPEYPAELGGILHLPLQKQEHIKNSIVKPFLCCYNPEWLYRIYQDTVVDLKSFSSVINNIHQTNDVINKNDLSYNARLFPTEVQNISCQLTSSRKLRVVWEKPWNVHFMNTTTVEYELWYQDNDENDVKAFLMQKTHFSFEKNSTNIYVWIRCHVNGKIGPFNLDPLICQK